MRLEQADFTPYPAVIGVIGRFGVLFLKFSPSFGVIELHRPR
jgi:hypothetical protein